MAAVANRAGWGSPVPWAAFVLALAVQALALAWLDPRLLLPFHAMLMACAISAHAMQVVVLAIGAVAAAFIGFAPARDGAPVADATTAWSLLVFAASTASAVVIARRRTAPASAASLSDASPSVPPPATGPDLGGGLRATLDAMQEGFQIIDRDWRYVYLNSPAAAHGQRERDALIGHTMMAAYPGIEQTPLFATLRDCMAHRRAAHLENHFIYPDGSSRWFELSVQPAPDGIVVVSLDISARKQAQAEMQRLLADLDQRNNELQEFAAFASHDLQEPLRKIRMFSERLLADHAAGMSVGARDYLGRSVRAAERMQTLIDDLLALTRAAHDVETAPVDLGTIVAAAIDILEERIESSAARIDVAPLPTIEGDASQLRQLFQNLIANALKFRDASRPPVVRVDAHPTRLADGSPAHAIRVVDNGIGFDPPQAERIFAPFQRLHGRAQYEGSGIGLAIVRRIVERHGGTVSATATPGEGAVFTVVLPARPPARAPA